MLPIMAQEWPSARAVATASTKRRSAVTGPGTPDVPSEGWLPPRCVGVWLVVLEAVGELVCLFEDLFQASGHPHLLRYLVRTGIASTMTGPSSEVTTPTS